MIRIALPGIELAFRTHARVVRMVPLLGRLEGIVLDTILGPEEHFEYRSTTAPPTPPPV